MAFSKYIKQFSNLKTPFYFYDINVLKQTLEDFALFSKKHDFHIHYALKANANDKILKLIQSYGFGADCVSGNEILKAIENGFDPKKIVFAGVGKSDEEIRIGLEHDIFSFNCESYQEIEIINQAAKKMNKIADIALRINPDVNAKTHHYITTGLEENKFGINFWELDKVLSLIKKSRNIRLKGLHFHIGSQITDLCVFKSLCLRINEIHDHFIEKRFVPEYINVGGGLGTDYKNPDKSAKDVTERYFSLFDKHLKRIPGQEIHFEPGRAITAQCGSLISKVLYIKEGVNINFAILDAGMTDLLRPALYQAYHKIEALTGTDKKKLRYDVVGPICESSDTFAKSVLLPEQKRGDLIAIRSAGAYGEVMASRYNLKDLPEAVYSDEL